MDSSASKPSTVSQTLVSQLSQSQIYRDYEKAFRETTGLPINLRPVETFNLPHSGDPNENPFCALMAKTSRTCAACLDVQEKVAENPGAGPRTVTCFAGLSDTAIPLRFGHELVGFLQTGQVFLAQPNRDKFDRTARQLLDWGLKTDLGKLEDAWFHTRVLKPDLREDPELRK